MDSKGVNMTYTVIVLSIFLNGQPFKEEKITGPHAWEICEILRDDINQSNTKLEARCTYS